MAQKPETAMNAKISVLAICIEMIIYFSLYKIYEKMPLFATLKSKPKLGS